MPGATPNQNYPYPLDSDLIDVSGDIESLAEAVDTDVEAVEVEVAKKVSKTGDTMTGMLSLPGTNPTSLNHATRKGYVDDTFVNEAGDSMSGPLDMANNRITGLPGPPTDDTDAARKGYVDSVHADAVKKSVTTTQTVQGPLKADAFVMTDATEPSGPWHAVPLNYFNEHSLTNPMDTNLNMGGHYIWNLDDPDNGGPNSATTREWVRAHCVMTDIGSNVPAHPTVWGGEWDQEQPAVRIQSDGRIFSTVTTAGHSMVINRSGAAEVNAGVFIHFARNVDDYRGAIRFEDDNTAGIQYEDISDYRYKERVGPIADAAERVQRLARQAYRGRWRSGGGERDFLNAHDIAEVAPHAVSGVKDGPEPQMADKTKLIPMLVAALGEALERIDQLEARLA